LATFWLNRSESKWRIECCTLKLSVQMLRMLNGPEVKALRLESIMQCDSIPFDVSNKIGVKASLQLMPDIRLLYIVTELE